MPLVRDAGSLPVRRADGVTETLAADPEVFGVPVPMRMRRFAVEPGITATLEAVGDEVMAYVLAGSGTLVAGTEQHALAPESMAWVEAGPLQLIAGDDGLSVLVVEAPGPGDQRG